MDCSNGLRILVTGGAGFIGSHLVERLIRHGYESVTVLDNLSRGRTTNLAAGWDSIQFVKGDIRDEQTVAALMQETGLVFHLAAQSNVIGAIQDVDYASSTNIVGTAVIMKAARAAGVRRMVFTSSREVYGDPSSLPVPETAPLIPKNAYGMSKVAGEMCCMMSAGQPPETAILRLANVYGPRDYGRVIPLFIENAQNDRPVTIYGGNQVLDLVHVDHVVDALLKVGCGDHVAGPVNVGSGKGTTIVQLAERIFKLTNSHAKIFWEPARQAEVTRFVADTERGRIQLGLEHPDEPLSRLPELIVWSLKQAAPVLRGVAV